jgi:hypothetical protein
MLKFLAAHLIAANEERGQKKDVARWIEIEEGDPSGHDRLRELTG